jgi:hypothetical protein
VLKHASTEGNGTLEACGGIGQGGDGRQTLQMIIIRVATIGVGMCMVRGEKVRGKLGTQALQGSIILGKGSVWRVRRLQKRWRLCG